jgi:outer membrane protein assembly factor BamB
VHADGSLIWHDALHECPHGYPAFGNFDGGKLQAIDMGFSKERWPESRTLATPIEGGEIRCYDVASGKIVWRMPSPTIPPGVLVESASADIDSDGRDEAIFAVGPALYCVATKNGASAGEIRWKLDFDSHLSAPALADVDGTGELSIVVVGENGTVYGVR